MRISKKERSGIDLILAYVLVICEERLFAKVDAMMSNCTVSNTVEMLSHVVELQLPRYCQREWDVMPIFRV